MKKFVPIFIPIFFLSLSFGALLYIKSPLLNTFFSSSTVSLIFLLSALGSVGLFIQAPKFLNRYSKEWVLFYSLTLTVLATFTAYVTSSPWLLALAIGAYEALVFLTYYCYDIHIEKLSSNGKTGEIRGTFWTILNIGIALGPLLASKLVEGEDTKPIFLVASFLLIIPLLISFVELFKKRIRHVHHTPTFPLKSWWRMRNVRAVTLTKFILEIFFTLMVIYLPVYLHNTIGFSWSQLGIMFTVALLPFVILEWPAGKLADKYWGEKEMMSVGLFLTGTALIVMPFLGQSFWAWMSILFLSRMGASLIEIMTESYFFKKIDETKTGLISIFRLARPVGIIFGTIIGAIGLSFLSFEKLFFVIAVVILFGLYESLHLKDTK